MNMKFLYAILAGSTENHTESQDGCGGKEPSEVVWSKTPAQAGSARAMSRQLLKVSRNGDSATSLGSASAQSLLIVKKHFLKFRQSFLCFSLCSSSHCASLKRAWLHLCTLPSGIYRHR